MVPFTCQLQFLDFLERWMKDSPEDLTGMGAGTHSDVCTVHSLRGQHHGNPPSQCTGFTDKSRRIKTWEFPSPCLRLLFSQERNFTRNFLQGQKYEEETFNKIAQIPTPASKCCFVLLINRVKHGL